LQGEQGDAGAEVFEVLLEDAAGVACFEQPCSFEFVEEAEGFCESLFLASFDRRG